MPDRLIVCTRYPQPGRVKTRLIPALGADGVAQLHEALTRRTLEVGRQFRVLAGFEIEVRVADGEVAEMRSLCGDDAAYVRQAGAELGERLAGAVSDAFAEGMRRVLVVGTDCPELTPELLAEAIDALNAADVVLGPALDGGYYLIGLRAAEPRLFRNIAWGTDAVLAQTRDAARRLKLTVWELPRLSDIDEPEDLVVWRRVVGGLPGQSAVNRPGIVSVIIPTLNESPRIAEALRPLLAAPDVEVIVADGGSTDGTADVARDSGARVVATRRGRGRQMNAGAAVATGERLLFVHADTRLPEDFQKHVGAVLNGGACAGAFRLRIEGGRRGLRVVEWGANVRSRWLQLPYGDQGLFLPAELFYRMGGYRELPLMEDFEFCRRLRKYGRIGIASASATTSGRRWEGLGIVRTTIVNQLCVAGYLLGVSPERVARWYVRPTKRS